MDFKQLYAEVHDDGEKMSDNEYYFEGSIAHKKFIDDSNILEDASFHRSFENVSRNLDEPVNDYFDWLIDKNSQPENYTASNELNEIEFDELENEKARIDMFKSVWVSQ